MKFQLTAAVFLASIFSSALAAPVQYTGSSLALRDLSLLETIDIETDADGAAVTVTLQEMADEEVKSFLTGLEIAETGAPEADEEDLVAEAKEEESLVAEAEEEDLAADAEQ